VPELPPDAALYARCLSDAGYFESVAFTSDDSRRAEQYAANASRDALRDATETMEDFLRGLDMSVSFGSFRGVDLARIAQLIGKTNQFNPTTRRHSLEHVAQFTKADECLTLQFRLVDRFGDNGLVSAMILTPAADMPGLLEIDTWVMSCRVFGRQLEQEAMNIAVETAARMGVREFRADYLPTAKNSVVSNLYEALGFTREGQPPVPGATRWHLRFSNYVPHTTQIARRPEYYDGTGTFERVDAGSSRPVIGRFDHPADGNPA
jgi:FkbH-like protein